MEQKTYTVEEFTTRIKNQIESEFSDEIWIKGVIHGYGEASSGHTYFDLTEPIENPGDVPKFLISIALFKRKRTGIKSLQEGMQLENGLKVRIRGKAGIYAPRGTFQIVMSELDESYTISELEQNKKRLLIALQNEGLLDKNKQLSVGRLPLRLALITSKGSAAHNDFEDELKKSGYSWKVILIHSSIQGEAAPREICAALKKAATQDVDAVALVRGGGSQLDLAAFDDETVVRTIADMPLPVFCGIGHEIDYSVADEVAHISEKTPTACARRLVDLVTKTAEELESLSQNILASTRQLLQNQATALNEFSYRLAHALTQMLNDATSRMASAQTELSICAIQVLVDAKNELLDHGETIKSLPTRQLDYATSKIYSYKKRIDALNPQEFLKRGWSITRTKNGTLVKDAKKIPTNTQLITQVAKGKIESTSN